MSHSAISGPGSGTRARPRSLRQQLMMTHQHGHGCHVRFAPMLPRRTAREVQQALGEAASASGRGFVSAVAFRGLFRTEPKYVQVAVDNADPEVTGRGIVDALGVNGEIEYCTSCCRTGVARPTGACVRCIVCAWPERNHFRLQGPSRSSHGGRGAHEHAVHRSGLRRLRRPDIRCLRRRLRVRCCT